MSINNTIAKLELAQIGWVVPDINAAVKLRCHRDHGYYGWTVIEQMKKAF